MFPLKCSKTCIKSVLYCSKSTSSSVPFPLACPQILFLLRSFSLRLGLALAFANEPASFLLLHQYSTFSRDLNSLLSPVCHTQKLFQVIGDEAHVFLTLIGSLLLQSCRAHPLRPRLGHMDTSSPIEKDFCASARSLCKPLLLFVANYCASPLLSHATLNLTLRAKQWLAK